MSKSRFMFNEPESDNSDGEDDEMIKKLYKKLKNEMNIKAEPPKKEKKKRVLSEDAKTKMKNVLELGRAKALEKRLANKAKKTEIAEEHEKTKIQEKLVEPVKQEKQEKLVEPVKPVESVKPVELVKPVENKPSRVILMGGANMHKFWYS
jgi:hypothetical protein